jgi:hypothetical protein
VGAVLAVLLIAGPSFAGWWVSWKLPHAPVPARALIPGAAVLLWVYVLGRIIVGSAGLNAAPYYRRENRSGQVGRVQLTGSSAECRGLVRRCVLALSACGAEEVVGRDPQRVGVRQVRVSRRHPVDELGRDGAAAQRGFKSAR